MKNYYNNVDKLDLKLPNELDYSLEKAIPICSTSWKIRIDSEK